MPLLIENKFEIEGRGTVLCGHHPALDIQKVEVNETVLNFYDPETNEVTPYLIKGIATNAHGRINFEFLVERI